MGYKSSNETAVYKICIRSWQANRINSKIITIRTRTRTSCYARDLVHTLVKCATYMNVYIYILCTSISTFCAVRLLKIPRKKNASLHIVLI